MLCLSAIYSDWLFNITALCRLAQPWWSSWHWAQCRCVVWVLRLLFLLFLLPCKVSRIASTSPPIRTSSAARPWPQVSLTYDPTSTEARRTLSGYWTAISMGRSLLVVLHWSFKTNKQGHFNYPVGMKAFWMLALLTQACLISHLECSAAGDETRS